MFSPKFWILFFTSLVCFYMTGCNKNADTDIKSANSAVTTNSQTAFVFHDSENATSKAYLELLLPYAKPFVEHGKDKGLVISVITPDGVSTVGLGMFASDSPQNTIMELGSISKAFIGMAFASMVNDGTVKADTPLRDCLPKDVQIPGKESLTLGMLSTHTSGLPRLPDGFVDSVDLNDPYRAYGLNQAWADLGKTNLNQINEYEYSNFGASILAHALTVCAKEQSWETLIAHRVTDVLQLQSVNVHAPLPQGYDPEGNPVSAWAFDEGMAPSGALRANAADLAKLVQMFLTDDSFAGSAMLKTSIRPLFVSDKNPNISPMDAVAMNWHLGVGVLLSLYEKTSVQESMKELVWHNGGTGSGASYIGFIPSKSVGVVILSNQSTESPTLIALLGLGRILGESAERMNQVLATLDK